MSEREKREKVRELREKSNVFMLRLWEFLFQCDFENSRWWRGEIMPKKTEHACCWRFSSFCKIQPKIEVHNSEISLWNIFMLDHATKIALLCPIAVIVNSLENCWLVQTRKKKIKLCDKSIVQHLWQFLYEPTEWIKA